MRELTASDVRELWSYREHWLGVVSATDSATPLDVVGWALANCGSDDPYAALAFFEAGVRTGAIRRMFQKVSSPEWQKRVELIILDMIKKQGRLDLSSDRESFTLQETMYLGLFHTH